MVTAPFSSCDCVYVYVQMYLAQWYTDCYSINGEFLPFCHLCDFTGFSFTVCDTASLNLLTLRFSPTWPKAIIGTVVPIYRDGAGPAPSCP